MSLLARSWRIFFDDFAKRVSGTDLLYTLMLFVFVVLLCNQQYIFGGVSYPSGWDSLVVLDWMFRSDVYGISNVIFSLENVVSSHGGYIFLAYSVRKILGVDFFAVEKFLPSILTFILAVTYSVIVLFYTSNKRLAYIAGFVTPIFYGQILLTSDLHGVLLSQLLFVIAIALLFRRLKCDDLSQIDLSNSRAKARYLGGLLASRYSLAVLLLLYYSAFTHVETFAVWTVIIFLALLITTLKNLALPTGRMRLQLLWVLSLLAIVLITILLVGWRYMSIIVSRYYQLVVLPPETKYSEPTLENVLLSLSFGDSWHIPPFIWYEHMGLAFFIYLGVIKAIREFRSSKIASQTYVSGIIISWFVIAFLLTIAVYFRTSIAATRGISLIPAPILLVLGASFIAKRVRSLHIVFMKDRKEVFNKSFSLAYLILAIMLLPPTFYAFSFFWGRSSYIDNDLIQRIDWIDTHQNNGKVPLFVIDIEGYYFENSIVVEMIMGNHYRQYYDVADYPKGVYFGRIWPLLEGRYTPYRGDTPSWLLTWGVKRFESNTPRWMFSNYSLMLLSQRLGEITPDRYDIYVLTPLYSLNEAERGLVVEVHEGVFKISSFSFSYGNLYLGPSYPFETEDAADNETYWSSLYDEKGRISINTSDKMEGLGSMEYYATPLSYDGHFVAGVRYNPPGTWNFRDANFLSINFKTDSLEDVGFLRINLRTTANDYMYFDIPVDYLNEWTPVILPLDRYTQSKGRFDISNVDFIDIELFLPKSNGLVHLQLDKITVG